MNSPIISILIPSRGRPKGLRTAIDSFLIGPREKGDVEFCIRFDSDEYVEWECLAGLRERILIRTGPRERGYPDLNEWYTELDRMATAPFVWMWNDDCTVGGDWRTPIKKAADKLRPIYSSDWVASPVVLKAAINVLGQSHFNGPDYCPFPVAPRGWYKALGWNKWCYPADTGLVETCVKQNGWAEIFMEGVTVWHNRASDAELSEHRKLK